MHTIILTSGAVPFLDAKYGQGIGLVQLDHVVCSGTEMGLEFCEHDGIGVASCGHADDAGVRCQGYYQSTFALYT